jgi:hypothetical protein
MPDFFTTEKVARAARVQDVGGRANFPVSPVHSIMQPRYEASCGVKCWYGKR